MENTPILLYTYIYIYLYTKNYMFSSKSTVFKTKTTAGTNVMDRVANKVTEAVERLV